MENCMNCNDRCADPNCHMTCEKYAAYRAENERRKEERYRDVEIHKAVIELVECTKRKMRK